MLEKDAAQPSVCSLLRYCRLFWLQEACRKGISTVIVGSNMLASSPKLLSGPRAFMPAALRAVLQSCLAHLLWWQCAGQVKPATAGHRAGRWHNVQQVQHVPITVQVLQRPLQGLVGTCADMQDSAAESVLNAAYAVMLPHPVQISTMKKL